MAFLYTVVQPVCDIEENSEVVCVISRQLLMFGRQPLVSLKQLSPNRVRLWLILIKSLY